MKPAARSGSARFQAMPSTLSQELTTHSSADARSSARALCLAHGPAGTGVPGCADLTASRPRRPRLSRYRIVLPASAVRGPMSEAWAPVKILQAKWGPVAAGIATALIGSRPCVDTEGSLISPCRRPMKMAMIAAEAGKALNACVRSFSCPNMIAPNPAVRSVAKSRAVSCDRADSAGCVTKRGSRQCAGADHSDLRLQV